MQDQIKLLDHTQPTRSLVHSARLMDPDEVAQSLAGRTVEAERIGGHWFLCGDVSNRFYELAKVHRGLISYRLSGFRASSGLGYGLITHQLEDIQHRFVLPLYETRTAKCLREASAQPLAFSLGHDATNQAVIQMPPTMAPALGPLLAMHVPLTRATALQALDEFPLVVSAASQLDRVLSVLPGLTVREVSMSVLLPEEAVEMVAEGGVR
jgi:hypothetical protein